MARTIGITYVTVDAADPRSETLLEQGMREAGQERHMTWLVGQLESMSDSAILDGFQRSKRRPTAEGVWGTLVIEPFIVYTQFDVPDAERRRYGEQPTVKVIEAGTREWLRERVKEHG